jgi:hypothetical protein
MLPKVTLGIKGQNGDTWLHVITHSRPFVLLAIVFASKPLPTLHCPYRIHTPSHQKHQGKEGEEDRKRLHGGKELERLGEHPESPERVDGAYECKSHIKEWKLAYHTSSREGIETKEEIEPTEKKYHKGISVSAR